MLQRNNAMQSSSAHNNGMAAQCSSIATTMPRKRRPRRAAVGEVSISSTSCVFVNNALSDAAASDPESANNQQHPQQHGQSAVDPVYANSALEPAVASSSGGAPLLPARPHRTGRDARRYTSLMGHKRQMAAITATATVRRNFSVVLRQREKPLTTTTTAVLSAEGGCDDDNNGADLSAVAQETQHITMFIGEQLNTDYKRAVERKCSQLAVFHWV